MFGQDFQDLALVPVREAEVLLAAGLFDGAYYLAGLGVQCSLKACIAKASQQYEFPDLDRARAVFTHNLPALLKAAGLETAVGTAGPVKLQWGKVSAWTIESRYRLGVSESDAAEFVRIIADDQGNLAWLKQYW